MVKFGSKNRHQKDVLTRDWTTCSKFVNNSRLNSQHRLGGGGVCDHFITNRILTLIT